MRDDLYKTVPPTNNWRKVLRLACSKADWAAAKLAMKSAIETEVLARLDKKWLSEFKEKTNQKSGDLFGHDVRADIIAAHRKTAPTEAERAFCDIAIGLFFRNKPAKLFDESLATLERTTTEANIEHLCSVIRKEHGVKEAATAGRELREISNMNVDEKTVAAIRAKKRQSNREFLDQPVTLSF